jgi:hypothetical protein
MLAEPRRSTEVSTLVAGARKRAASPGATRKCANLFLGGRRTRKSGTKNHSRSAHAASLPVKLEDNQRVIYTYTGSADVMGDLSCKCHAVLGADRAAELGSLPI